MIVTTIFDNGQGSSPYKLNLGFLAWSDESMSCFYTKFHGYVKDNFYTKKYWKGKYSKVWLFLSVLNNSKYSFMCLNFRWTEIKNPNLKDNLKRHSPLFSFTEISFPGLTIKSTSTFKGDQTLIKDWNIPLMDCSKKTYNAASRNRDIVS